MPIGSFTAIPYVAQRLALKQPQRVLDVGIGFGMYGAVVRQWVDEGVQPWRTFLVGVEAWPHYRNPVWDLYNVISVGPVEHYLQQRHEHFDCIILGDIIEHFPKDEGQALLERLKPLVAPQGLLLVITPVGFHQQAAAHGNPYECHRSSWSAQDLEAFGFELMLNGTEPQVASVPTLVGNWTNRS